MHESAGRVHSLGLTEPFLVMTYGSNWVVGDKSRGYFKMNIQIVNTQTPNSVNNTCAFSCFEASDTVSNLHEALNRFRGEVTNICTMKWK